MSADGPVHAGAMRLGCVVDVARGSVAGGDGAMRLGVQAPHYLPATARRQTRLRRRPLICEPVASRPYPWAMRPGALICGSTG